MKILNLYSGIGGNRKLWGDEHSITAIEYDVDIAQAYQDFFPNDKVLVTDAHEYLLNNFDKYDFIWASPPCPSHGQYRYRVGVLAKGYKPMFPDMKLYEEIIFLKHHAKCGWAVENVQPYYEPLVAPTVTLQRHLVWSNFPIEYKIFESKGIRIKNKISDYPEWDLSKYKIANKRQVLRNCVEPELGLHIFNCFIDSTRS